MPLYNTLLQKAASIGPDPQMDPENDANWKKGMMPLPPSAGLLGGASKGFLPPANEYDNPIVRIAKEAAYQAQSRGAGMMWDAGKALWNQHPQALIQWLVDHGPMPDAEKDVRLKRSLSMEGR